MKLEEAIRLSVAEYFQKYTDNGIRNVVSFAREIHVGGEEYTRIYYTHSGPTREVRSHLYYGTMQDLLNDVDLANFT